MMLKYILKRILLFFPTLLAISLITFFISVNAPGDPVEVMLNKSNNNGGQSPLTAADEKDYKEMRHRLGLDQPLFYLSVTDATVSDALAEIPETKQREFLKRLSAEYGNPDNVLSYYAAIKKSASYWQSGNGFWKKNTDAELLNSLSLEYNQEKMNGLMSQFSEPEDTSQFRITSNSALNYYHALSDLHVAFHRLVAEKNPYKKYIPVIHWHGTHNQYHHWVTNFIAGDFGVSYQDKRPVKTILYSALQKTLMISVFSIFLTYLIAIPLGVQAAVKKGTGKEKSITAFLFILYSLPNFWIATLLIIFFCGGDYLSWFPAPGAPPIAFNAPFWYKLVEATGRLALPLFCWTYGALAFVSRQMRGGILDSLEQDYMQTARAKGLTEKQVIWKHALKNSLLPIITLFASVFPLVFSGAFVIENIFNLPGIGKLSLEALSSRDYPVIFTVMMFTAILTMLGNLLADLLYTMADPRISFTQ
jgi:peptide/nickel transport system permease protein